MIADVDDSEIRRLVAALDTTKAAEGEEVWERLRPLGPKVLPFFRECYPRMKKWQGRAAVIFRSIRYAREYEDAFLLGIEATKDKATLVRYRGCMVLAYSLRRNALPTLRELLGHADSKTVEDARAAIDAIESRNHHYFVDREHSGRAFWEVGGAA